MSSVLRRTIFVDRQNVQVRFHDWALVGTTLGPMIEPLNWNRVPTKGTHYNPQDELAKINMIENMDILREMHSKQVMGTTGVLHSGPQLPQDFHYNS